MEKDELESKRQLAQSQLEFKKEVTQRQLALIEAISNSIKEISSLYLSTKHSHNKVGIIVFGSTVGGILVAIVLLSFFGKLSPEVTGTLIASIIGYAIGKFSNVKDGNRGE